MTFGQARLLHILKGGKAKFATHIAWLPEVEIDSR
jgi:hypothetical protein